jgi:S-adenosylmethionine-dependent methyltransferase
MEEQHQLSRRSLRVLDAAGGNGRINEGLLKLNQYVTFVDISNDMIGDGRERIGNAFEDRISFEVRDIENELPNFTELFDLVVLHNIIEYLADPQKVFEKMGNV